MRKFIFLVAIILSLNIGCDQNQFMIFRLTNFKDTSFHFQSKSLHPTLLEVSISGNSDNSFIINNIILEGGKIDTVLKMDWYKDTVILNFIRYNATKGNLIFKCKTY